jgi:hypothetical protein
MLKEGSVIRWLGKAMLAFKEKETMFMLIFCVVTPCELAGKYQRFGGTKCLHLQGLKMKAVCASETSASTCKSTWRYNADD